MYYVYAWVGDDWMLCATFADAELARWLVERLVEPAEYLAW